MIKPAGLCIYTCVPTILEIMYQCVRLRAKKYRRLNLTIACLIPVRTILTFPILTVVDLHLGTFRNKDVTDVSNI